MENLNCVSNSLGYRRFYFLQKGGLDDSSHANDPKTVALDIIESQPFTIHNPREYDGKLRTISSGM